MKNFALTLFLPLGLILNLSPFPEVSNASEISPVLMYHDIKTVPVNGFDVSTKDFAAQLDLLQSKGCTTLGLDDFAKYLASGDFPAKSVVITFDDGYRGVYLNALPELRKRNMKAVLFIITDMVGRLDTGYPHITEAEFREMASDDLISFGSHSLDHPDLAQLSREERLSQLTQFRKNLESLTGRKIHAFAYPYGSYNTDIAAEVQSAGYDFAFAVDDRGIPEVPEHFRIPRIYMRNSMTPEKLAGFLENISPDAFTDEYGDLAVSYDVVIAGGGMGGTGAALQASKMGMRVLVVEPSYMLGGQATAAGVSTMDDMSGIESGVYHDFMNRVRAHYAKLRKSISTPYWKTYGKAFEPSVGHKILAEMMTSPDILYMSEIVKVDSDNVTVKTPEGSKKITYKILIDATEYGDIMPLAGIRYRTGNSIAPEIGDTMIQDITWTAIIRKYPDGVPEHLKPKSPLPGYDKALKNYRGYVSRKGFDFSGKYPVKMPVNIPTHNSYRAVPDSFLKGSYTGAKSDWKRITKTGVNWGNDYPGAYLWHGRYGLPVNYLESPDLRAYIEREALIKTLHYIYYIQNELGENWSVDENEYNYLPEAAKNLPEEWQEIAKHMPPIPYVRESRRVLGDYTMNSRAIRENSSSYRNGSKNREFPDAIAIAGYNLDLHGGDDDDDIEKSLGETQASIYRDSPLGPFQVPMRVLIPESSDNPVSDKFLAAEKNLSMSRLASGGLRLQPICMMTGQAAGALAAVAIREGVSPREVKAFRVQKALLDSGVRLSLCNYADVPARHEYFGSVQLASLYRLMEPRTYPNVQAGQLHSGKKKGTVKGRFGLNEAITEREMDIMLARAEEICGKKIVLKHKVLTRGQAVDFVIRAMCEK
ncbi:MAG: FAD-dependent oxidoreductase [Synergistaceae bacterium]|nr:FAD-dependent oxidoreductase [Synergistaceae bacterium]